MATTEPQKYRKKAVEIEAKQFTGTSTEAHAAYLWVENHIGSFEWADPDPANTQGITIDPADGFPVIRTLEGDMKVSLGDWIIRGVQGEFYPCKPDIFEATYTTAEPRPELVEPKVNLAAASEVVKDMVTDLLFRMHGVISSYDNTADAEDIVKAIAPLLEAKAREGILRIAARKLMPKSPVLLGTFDDGKYWAACALEGWADEIRDTDSKRLRDARSPHTTDRKGA